MSEKRDYTLLLTKAVLNFLVLITWLIVVIGRVNSDDVIVALLTGQIYALLTYDIKFYRFIFYSALFVVAAYFMPFCISLLALGFIYSRHVKQTFWFTLALIGYQALSQFSFIVVIGLLLALMTFTFSHLTRRYLYYRKRYESQRDAAIEIDHAYRSRENQLEQLLDSKAHASVLAERNRIAGELHDHIGHTISSAIVQAEAYKAIYLESDRQSPLENRLAAVEGIINTLKDGMIDIRTSLHHLRDRSLDLEAEFDAMRAKYPGLEMSIYLYKSEQMPFDMKTKLIRVISEALANVAKHSDATRLKLSVVKQRNFYSLIVKDNGSNLQTQIKPGMGLDNMRAVAESYAGNFSYGYQAGFYIHMTLYVED